MSGDRRVGPRRREEVRLHYAREALVGAATNMASIGRNGTWSLHRAIRDYRDAEREVRMLYRRPGAPDLRQSADHDPNNQHEGD